MRSLEFQRLRYIRQNGLLHFVFPGAVHTRFAHSLGTMANAQAVWHRITADLLDQDASEALVRARQYLGAVFEMSALLHDIGHCAFSHSSEKVTIKNAPLFGTLGELFQRWDASEMLAALLSDDNTRASEPAKHEEIGLILIRNLFRGEADRIGEAAKSFGVDPATLGVDVIGVLHECPAGRTDQLNSSCAAFPPSGVFAEHAAVLIKALEKRWGSEVASPNSLQQLRNILHDLVSSTLDVDRLDYLLRDSLFCGAPYGRYDREMLIGSLEIVVDAGRLYLTLDHKAAFALDDMLWSRYQMFIQIYNHKTNVIMDHMLGRALEWAIDQGFIIKPRMPDEYVAFTDDLVMGKVFEQCSRAEGARDQVFGMTLTRRSVPRCRGSSVLTEFDKTKRAAEMDRLRETKERDLGTRIIALPTKSDLIKGEMPRLRVWEKGAGKPTLEAFANRSSILQNRTLNPSHHMVLFFEEPTANSAPSKSMTPKQTTPYPSTTQQLAAKPTTPKLKTETKSSAAKPRAPAATTKPREAKGKRR